MIRPDFAKWGQTPDDLRRLAVEAEHVRSRERFQALYMIGTQQFIATEWAAQIGRKDQTVQGWVHQDNRAGPAALSYRHSGGRTPFLPSGARGDRRHGQEHAAVRPCPPRSWLDAEKAAPLGRDDLEADSQS